MINELLMSKARLKQMKIIDGATCDLCGDYEETSAHLVFYCCFSVQCWNLFQGWVEMSHLLECSYSVTLLYYKCSYSVIILYWNIVTV